MMSKLEIDEVGLIAGIADYNNYHDIIYTPTYRTVSEYDHIGKFIRLSPLSLDTFDYDKSGKDGTYR